MSRPKNHVEGERVRELERNLERRGGGERRGKERRGEGKGKQSSQTILAIHWSAGVSSLSSEYTSACAVLSVHHVMTSE